MSEEINAYDVDGDGKVSDKEFAVYQRKQQAQRRMAIATLVSMAIFTIAMFMPFIPDSRVKLLSDLSTLFYVTGGGIVGAYMGVSAWMSKK